MRAFVLAAVALTLTGCGHSVSGKRVFASQCEGCHTLTGHDTQARGGDLAIARLSTRDLLGFVRVMPVRLSSADADAVAAYVHAAANP